MNLFKDKKGFVQILTFPVILTILIFAILIVAGVLIFTSINTFAVIGGGMIALALIFGLRGNFTRTKATFLGIVILLGLVLVIASGTLQSVLSVSQVQTSVDGGKVYWTIFASANSIDEQYDFVKKFDKYTYSDGKTVTPQKSLAILVTEQSSSCRYNLIDLGNNIKGLSIPSKDIDILVLDGNSGQSQILQGERPDQVIINDPDGKGQLIVSSEGLLGGANECPDYENVAIVERSGQLTPVYKDQILAGRTACGTNIFSFACLSSLFSKANVNNQLVNSFDSYSISSTQFVGTGLDLGSATFTIRADEEYFNSVIFTPAKDCDPRISNIEISNEIRQESSANLRVNLVNGNSNSCKVTIVPSGNDISFSPTSRDTTLTNSAQTTFTISNGQNLGDKKVDVEVCFVGFTGKKCDVKSVTFKSVKASEDTGQEEIPGTIDEDVGRLECKFFETEGVESQIFRSTINEISFGLFDKKSTEVITTPVCKTSGWVKWLFVTIIILILGITYMRTLNPRRRRK